MTDYAHLMSGDRTVSTSPADLVGGMHHHLIHHSLDPCSSFAGRGGPASGGAKPSTATTGGGGGTFAGIPTQSSMLQAVDKLKFFLATAPSHFDQDETRADDGPRGGRRGGEGGQDAAAAREERCLNRFQLPTGELISCVLWNGLFHVTGTDIVRVLHFRFAAFGRPVRNPKKFEEGIFSDLRNLKSGTDATLEEPKSEFLELLFKYNCIRTQKKQKVFYWFSVPHDRLFLDALDRDLKREKLGVEPTTESVAEPALSFSYNPNKSLYEQFTEQQQSASEGTSSSIEATMAATGSARRRDSSDEEVDAGHSRTDSGGRTARHRPASLTVDPSFGPATSGLATNESDGSQVVCLPPSASVEGHAAFRSANSDASDVSTHKASTSTTGTGPSQRTYSDPSSASALFGAFALFEGSPTYKQRRKPGQQKKPSPLGGPGPARRERRSTDDSPPRLQTLVSPTGPSTAGTMANGRFGSGGGGAYRTASAAGLTLPALTAEPPPPPQTYYPQYGAYQHHHLAQPISPYAPHPALTMPATSSAPSSFLVGGSGQGLDQQGHHGHGQAAIATPSVSAVDLAAAAASQVVVSSAEDGQGVKTYSCPLFSCGRLFKRYEHLKRHLRIHTEEKPYACTKCEKRFARTDNLSAHLKIHEKMAARQGSTSSADQRALDAEEEADERQSPSLTGYDASPGPTTTGTGAGGGPTSSGAGFSEFYVGFQPGLPTPPIGPTDHPQQHHPHHHHPSSASSAGWAGAHQHHHSAGWAHSAALLTPDPSPDPSSFYGARPVPGGGGEGSGGAGDESRHSSIASTRGHTYLEGSSSSSEYPHHHHHHHHQHGYPTGSSASPLMSSFQHQLSMVNSLNAEMQANDAASLLSFASGHQPHHPSYPSHSGSGGYLHPATGSYSSTSPPPTSAGLLPMGASASSLSSSAGSSSAHHHQPTSGLYGAASGAGDDQGAFRSVAAADYRGF